MLGRQHGTLAKSGKVRKQTPKVAKQERPRKIPKGRSYKRLIYNKRYANTVVGDNRKKKTPNWHAGRKDLIEQEAEKKKAERR